LITKYGPQETWTKEVHVQKDVWFFQRRIEDDETIAEGTRWILKLNAFLQASHREGMGLEWCLERMEDPDLPAPQAGAISDFSATMPRLIRDF